MNRDMQACTILETLDVYHCVYIEHDRSSMQGTSRQALHRVSYMFGFVSLAPVI